MRKRFRKANRHTAFFNVYDAILAQNAQDAATLKSLEAQYGWPQADDFREEFVVLGEVLRDLHETLQPLSDEQIGEVQSDEQIGLVRSALVDVYVLSKRLKARMPKVFDMCATYHADLVAQSNAQGKAKANSAQDIDFTVHWIDKVLLTYTDFRQVRHIIGSPTLDAVLTEEIEITSAVQSPAEASVLVTVDSLKDALGTNLGVVDDDLGDFLRTRAKNGTDERVKVPGCIHCECAVFAELDNIRRMGDTIISLFEAYRKVTKQDMRCRAVLPSSRGPPNVCLGETKDMQMRGTHDQTYPWRCPTLMNDVVDRKIRTELSDRLGSLLVADVVRFANKRRSSTSSVTSLSTTASGDEIADDSIVLPDLVASVAARRKKLKELKEANERTQAQQEQATVTS